MYSATIFRSSKIEEKIYVCTCVDVTKKNKK